MQGDVYKKIIDELAEKNFFGRLSPYCIGEPLLDTRLPALMEYARKKLPLCFISISTNGDFLNEDLFIKLIDKGVDHFLITNYDDEEKPLLKSLAHKYPLHITFRSYKDFPKVDRAGEIFKNGKSLNTPCLRPASSLMVNWKSNVLLCCQDFYETYSFGNIREKNLWDIWNDRQFVEYRNLLRLGHRSSCKICVHCDDEGGVPW
jgi:8-amino-3,8-dideoxy-alpha-D-manno-octulosonate transaminase